MRWLFYLDGEDPMILDESAMAEFIDVNEDWIDTEEVSYILNDMLVGDTVTWGGGAAPFSVLVRIPDE